MSRKMKDSGVEWIGEIPIDWTCLSLRKTLKFSITDGPHETPDYLDNGIPFISVDSLNRSRSVDLNIVRKFISNEDYKRFNKKTQIQTGDILFTKAATIGKTAIVGDEKFMVWSPIAVIKPNTEIIFTEFLYYVLSTEKFVLYASLLGTSNTQINLGMRALEKAKISLPTAKTEQERIAIFLKEKVDGINKLIDKTKNTVEDYKLLKQSIITEAVTKGLDKTVEMKDSGIQVIGHIPQHWEIRKMKTVARILRGASPRPIDAYLTGSEGYNWIKIGDTIKGSKYITETRQKITKSGAAKSRFVKKGSLLLTNSMSFGEGYILEIDGCIHDGWLAFADYKNVIKEYLYYIFISSVSTKQFELSVAGGVVQNLNIGKVGAIDIPIPTMTEQVKIIEYLDMNCKNVENLIERKLKLITEMEDYKKSLIYEYVTGKKEVK